MNSYLLWDLAELLEAPLKVEKSFLSLSALVENSFRRTFFDFFSFFVEDMSMGFLKNITKIFQRSTNQAVETHDTHCPACSQPRAVGDFAVCWNCGYHLPMNASERVVSLVDTGSFTGRVTTPSLMAGTARSNGYPVALAVVSGSIDASLGTSFADFVEECTGKRLPLLLIISTHGLDENDGVCALLRTATISAALERHSRSKLPVISILADGAMGIALTTFAAGSDFVIAEPGAVVGFSEKQEPQGGGMRRWLPRGFQTGEYLQSCGFVDAVLPRAAQRETIASLLDYMVSKK